MKHLWRIFTFGFFLIIGLLGVSNHVKADTVWAKKCLYQDGKEIYLQKGKTTGIEIWVKNVEDSLIVRTANQQSYKFSK